MFAFLSFSNSKSDTSRCGTSHDSRSRRGTASSNSSDGSDLFVSSDLCMRGDLLVSPRVSPLLWLKQCVPALVVSATNEDSGRHRLVLFLNISLRCVQFIIIIERMIDFVGDRSDFAPFLVK